MKKLTKTKLHFFLVNKLLSYVLFIAVLLILFIGLVRINHYYTVQNLNLTKEAIRKSVIQCYAIEGQYPSDLSYLEEHYYLNIDYNRYNVVYDSIGSNIMPVIDVFIK